MTNQPKLISFYPDTSKNEDFLRELKEILDQENSSIAECSIQKSVANNFCVFIIPKNPKYSFTNITFNFSHSFDKEGDDFITYYEKEGLSRNDIEQLNNLFKEYTFENHYEGLFFASKFFSKKSLAILYLKFSENEKNNKYILEGHKVARYYSIIDKENLEYLLENQVKNENSSLIKCNTYGITTYYTYGITTYDTIKEVIQKFNERSVSQNDDFFVIEHCRDYETIEYFLINIFKVVDNDLIKQDIKDFLSK